MAENLHTREDTPVSEMLHREQVGRRLRAAIEALGLSQATVAKAFHVSASKLGNWIRGDNYPSEWFLKQFCDRHGITTDWFYRGIVSGIDSALADTLWRSEQSAPPVEAAPEAAIRRRPLPRPKGGDPPRPTLGGDVRENRVRRAAACVVPIARVRAAE